MSESADSFAMLLARARNGDAAALAQLSAAYENRVRMVARVLLGPALRPHFDSMDLTQSVHRSILIGLRHDKYAVSSPENLVGLAVTIVHRKVARHWRHMRRQVRLSGESSPTDELPTALLSLTSAEGDPSQTAEYNDRVEHLCQHLTSDERVLIEKRLQGYSTVEIAEQLGLNSVTLRVRLNRMRQRLRSAGLLEEWL
jgi:RNA polymerase sigma-70 factor (ECF subfamily)